jgi:hypothetical protein
MIRLYSLGSLLLLFLGSLPLLVDAFVLQPRTASSIPTELDATKKKATTTPASSGFGGASIIMEPCPCGSDEKYVKCCGKVHTDANAYKSASAEKVVRARYSAYAKRQVDFIIVSTHPLNKNFDTDIKHWKETIK